ncbi:hypothetical protein [Variovorax sp. JS1663]|uniref:hypothetical protein n=1 Tax=Variovorax sp. JS1663 TaxID=1851577 RepID=UPI00117E57CF|nr:hypothetical protein [Variovorax sp. JS1663]
MNTRLISCAIVVTACAATTASFAEPDVIQQHKSILQNAMGKGDCQTVKVMLKTPYVGPDTPGIRTWIINPGLQVDQVDLEQTACIVEAFVKAGFDVSTTPVRWRSDPPPPAPESFGSELMQAMVAFNLCASAPEPRPPVKAERDFGAVWRVRKCEPLPSGWSKPHRHVGLQTWRVLFEAAPASRKDWATWYESACLAHAYLLQTGRYRQHYEPLSLRPIFDEYHVSTTANCGL